MNRKKYSVPFLLSICWMTFILAAHLTTVTAEAKSESSWAIYWYLCGSDLESESGAATTDLEELLEIDLPDDVVIVIETGGAQEWQNDVIEADYLERYVVNADGIECVAQEESASMGSPDTLADFLAFCHTNYPAEHEGVIIWDHGAGSVQGAVFDELYDYDSLTLEEFHEAFAQVYDLDEENPPLELIGFDCCLMATIDTAATFRDIASYMVASEETEPGCGWNYTGLANALAEDSEMDGSELGTVICDSYLEGCEDNGEEDETTLSVVDLSALPALLEAYDRVGQEALDHVMEDATYFAEFSKGAQNAENYGGNTEAAGYSNLVDIGSLVLCNEEILPESSNDVLEALDGCVVYKVNGKYRTESSGLSCYYSYNNDEEELAEYYGIGVSTAFNDLYEYGLTGEMSESFLDYISSCDITIDEVQEIQILDVADDEDIPVYFDEDGYAVIEVEDEMLNALTGVYCELGIWDEESDMVVWCGYDNDLEMDWDNGIFRDNFRDVWGAIDGHICYMDLIYEGEDYNLYLVPVLLNGEEYQLHVVYDYDYEEFEILGARKGLDDNGMSDRNLVHLKAGDELTTLLYVDVGDEESELYEFDTFEVEEETYFAEEELGDGEFVMSFLLSDCRGNEKWSEQVLFTVEEGEISADYF